MENGERKLNEAKSQDNKIEIAKIEKNPVEERSDRLESVNRELKSFSVDDTRDIEEIENKREQEFENKLQEIGTSGISISEETRKLIHRNMVDDLIESAEKENKRFDILKIKKIVLENIDHPQSQLMKRLFPGNAEGISEKVFDDSLEKLRMADKEKVNLPDDQRIKLFRETLEYFSKKNGLEKSFAHGTGSDAIRLSLAENLIKMDESGEHGEGSSSDPNKEQKGVSVANMEDPMADFTNLYYAKKQATPENLQKDLNFFADNLVENADMGDEIKESYLQSRTVDDFCNDFASRYEASPDLVKAEMSKEIGKEFSELSKEDVRKSKFFDMMYGYIDDAKNNYHFKNKENDQKKLESFDYVAKECEKAEDFPEIFYEGISLKDPEDICKIGKVITGGDLEKMKLNLLGDQYRFFMEKERYSFEQLRKEKKQILLRISEYMKKDDSEYSRLIREPKDDNRYEELKNQFPCIVIIDGSNYEITHPFDHFSVEDRFNNVKYEDVPELVVPQKKMEEVRKWLETSPMQKDKLPKLIPFEYYEIKRLINYQRSQES